MTARGHLKTHCHRGHDLRIEANVYRHKYGRRCKPCHLLRNRLGRPQTRAELEAIAEGSEIRSEQDERRIEMVIFRWLDLIDRANARKYKRELAA